MMSRAAIEAKHEGRRTRIAIGGLEPRQASTGQESVRAVGVRIDPWFGDR
jgi:hypothetical protein